MFPSWIRSSWIESDVGLWFRYFIITLFQTIINWTTNKVCFNLELFFYLNFYFLFFFKKKEIYYQQKMEMFFYQANLNFILHNSIWYHLKVIYMLEFYLFKIILFFLKKKRFLSIIIFKFRSIFFQWHWCDFNFKCKKYVGITFSNWFWIQR